MSDQRHFKAFNRIHVWRKIAMVATLGLLGYVFVATRMATRNETLPLSVNIIVAGGFLVTIGIVTSLKCPVCTEAFVQPPLFFFSGKCGKCGAGQGHQGQ